MLELSLDGFMDGQTGRAGKDLSGASTSTRSVTTTATSSYRDGTYSGQGTSRRGDVSVQGGTIANVQITRVSTRYPVSRIASLPGQVVKQQTANVNTISGATYSSQAFKQAIQQALTLAQVNPATVKG